MREPPPAAGPPLDFLAPDRSVECLGHIGESDGDSKHIGRVVVFTVRKAKAPKRRELCLPPGATQPARCT